MSSSQKLLLSQTSQIVEHQQELEAARGETFNIFSILKFETKEDSTHSAFLAELLDPNGSHMMGHIFLKLFLKKIGHEAPFDCVSASVTREFYIGSVDHKSRTGGRIDILIEDKTRQTISIENKIYALDQYQQIERYANFNSTPDNPTRNTVYYLTLDGSEPSSDSKGSLKVGKDVFCLSYKTEIVSWLEDCQKEAVAKPVIRESIRQYILLLKKLTHQLSDNEMKSKVIELIEKDYLSARTIADAIEEAEVKATNSLLFDIQAKIKGEISENWYVEIDDIRKRWSGLNLARLDQDNVWIKLEGYPFIYKTNNYYGLIADTAEAHKRGAYLVEKEAEYFSSFDNNKTWPFYTRANSMSFEDNNKRAELFDAEIREKIADDISGKMLKIHRIFDKHIPFEI